MSISRWKDKEVVVHIHNGIWLNYKKEHILVSSNEVDEHRTYYTEWSKSERERQIPYIHTCIWKLERWYQWSYMQGSKGDTDIKNRLLNSVGKKLLFSHLVMSDSLQPSSRPPCPSPSPGACSNSCLSNRWCHPTISSSVVPFSFHLQSFPASGSFLMSQLFTPGGQSSGASASVLPMNIQGWFPLWLTGLISLQSRGLSRVFSNTTVQNHRFFGAQLSSQSNSHIHTWLLEKS